MEWTGKRKNLGIFPNLFYFILFFPAVAINSKLCVEKCRIKTLSIANHNL